MGTSNLGVDTSDKTAAEIKGLGKSPGFENVKNIIADKLHCVAERLGEKGTDLNGESPMAKYANQASEWLEHSAEYVREFDCHEADSNIREYVKESPGRSLFIAGAVGLIIGAILRRR